MNDFEQPRQPEEKIFTNDTIPWSVGGEPEGDIVLSSRIRLARNLADEAFPHKLSPQKAREIAQRLVGEIQAIEGADFTYYEIALLEPLKRRILLEKHLISPELVNGRPGAGVAVSRDEKIAIMLNEEDIIRLQCFLPGLQLEAAWEKASRLEDALAQKEKLAFNSQFGYLTACPTNLGTGLRAGAMLHLPGLVMNKEAQNLFANLPRLGLTVRGLYGEGSQARGNLFQISNQITLGKGEEEIIAILKGAVLQITEAERKARQQLQSSQPIPLHDNIWRAYGLLRHARSMGSQEMMERLSQLRLGADLGLIKGLKQAEINEMMIKGQPAFLEANSGKTLSAPLRDWERAEILRKTLKQIMKENEND